jgi:hypothetical protein
VRGLIPELECKDSLDKRLDATQRNRERNTNSQEEGQHLLIEQEGKEEEEVIYVFISTTPDLILSQNQKKILDLRQGSKQRRMRRNVQLPIPSILFYLLAKHLPHVLCKDEIFRQTHKRKTSFRTYVPCPCRCQL